MISMGAPELTSPEAHIAALQKDLNQLYMAYDRLKNRFDKESTNLKDQKKENEKLQEQITDLTRKNKEMKEVICWLDGKCEEANSQIKALEARKHGTTDKKEPSTC